MRLFTTIAGLRRYLELHRFAQPIALSDEHSLSRDSFHSGNRISGDRISSDRSSGDRLSVGLVPTMGALHAGHLSLIHQARKDNGLVVVSIFVNPLQFAPNEDFQQYPRTLEQDQQLCQQAGADAIFAPSATELYGSAKLTQVVPPADLMATLCGRFRPGHFPGVATVVTKLIGIVQPDRAYFGQKDAQQLAILRRVVADLNLPVKVVGCPIVREANGLALSSRNRYLSAEERSQATVLYRSLRRAKQALKDGKVLRGDLLGALQQELSTVPQVKPQYIDLVHPDTMAPLEQIEDLGLLAIAAHVGSTRLIDNLLLRNRQPILAIDGPAGAGKSTVVRQVAHILGLIYLDTGAMYRAVTWLAIHSGIAISDEAAIAELVSQCDIVLGTEELGTTPQVWINGHNVTQAIRSLEVTAQVSAIAAQPAVRQELMKRQQAYGRKGGVVMDGRDIGTQVFPDAELKIFLTASVAERARRRFQELQGQSDLTLAQLEQAIAERDYQDSTRKISPLRKAEDAIEIQSDTLSIDEVVAKIVSFYQEKLVALKNDSV
ncbi:MAG: bifunctional pantoate--beta-alanine ligase/(d)CMP kinase [Oscillatoriophycideae cyanobacterium NC_groundwater_1537_Pr4_S-0.65um_50_18]|nr:bifunctional pantoate--beta-alanine ligase/(d)CMP kinase [Oscillatoriophycideae cyanobacterium NC_groundwater_1537_Pr4_S-0.65um_50_18]